MRFGSVGGGGRYDGLVSRFMGQPVPATGFSIGVSRLQAALTALGKLDEKAHAGPVLVTVFGAESMPAGKRAPPSSAKPASAPSFISVIPSTASANSSNMPTSAARLAR